MRDLFYEESAASAKANTEAKKYAVFHVLFIVLIVIAVLYAFFVLYANLGFMLKDKEGVEFAVIVIAWVAPLVFILLLAAFAFFWKKRYNVSYDYSVVEDELRVAKVLNGKKRKFIVCMKADFVLRFGLCERDSFARTLEGNRNSTRYLTPNKQPVQDKLFVYIVYSTSLEKAVYVIECKKEMVDYLVAAFGRSKLDLS